jgi:4-hydroxybenzoyl-CoA reductase subunit beta
MILPRFTLLRPRTLEEALSQLSTHGSEAMIIAGGTDVVPNLQSGLYSPRAMVDIKGIRDLKGISFHPERGLEIGALASITELAESPLVQEHYPVLAQAAATVASPILRNMGTLGGNLCLETRCLWYNQSFFWRKSCGFCLKKDGSVCHVAPGGKFCWAVWSGDTAPALLTLDAELEISGPRGQRRLPLQQFYRNDGMDRMRLEQDEILSRVFVPAHTAGYRGRYSKLRIRGSIDYPLAGVAIAMRVKDQTCQDVRVGITAVNPAPLLASEITSMLQGRPFSPELVDEAATVITRTGKPLKTSVSTPEYRRDMLRVYTRRALTALWTGQAGNDAN